MKKFLLAIICAVVAFGAFADDDLSIWKKNKGITVSFITHQSLTDPNFPGEFGKVPYQYNSSFGFGLNTGTSYIWPKGAGWAGNRIKVGVDVRWFDVSYVKYSKYPKIDGVDLKDFANDIEDGIYDPDDDPDGIDAIERMMANMGNQQVQLGVALGPVVSVAPFANMSNAARFLRANVFAHFNPGASVVIYHKDNGDMAGSWAFLPSWDFGVNFQWKNLVIGFEGRWSQAKYSDISGGDEEDLDDFDYDDFDGDIMGGISGALGSMFNTDKRTWKNASFRINIGLRF